MEDGAYIQKAQRSLDAILADKNRTTRTHEGDQVPIAEARQKPILDTVSERTKTRVLFITTDTSILTQTTKSLDGFVAIADVFHEVHIMVLRTGIAPKHPVLRVHDNTWLYTVHAKHDWQLPFAAWQMMNQELSFAEGFRPDVVIAREVGISAFVAYGAGRFYNRPTQLHVPHLYREPTRWFSRIMHQWLINTFMSIRVTTDALADIYRERYDNDVAVLPRYRDYTTHFTGNQGSYLQKKYPQFSFIILYIGDLVSESTAFYAIDSVRQTLRNPRVGFIMVGNGKGVMECERRATLLGIKDQVVIERRADDLEQYLASADVLLITDSNSTADEIALYGAAAGVPMVVSRTALRSDFFEEGKTAYIIDDVRSLKTSEYLLRLLNNGTERQLMRQQVRRVALQKLYVDPKLYQETFRQSVERAIIVREEALA